MNSRMRLMAAVSILAIVAACVVAFAPATKAAQNPGAQSGTPGGKTGTAFAFKRSADGDNTFYFATSEMGGFDMNPVKGAPFSAQGSMTFTQTLSDGTKITRQTNSVMYRDSEGRTRREENVGGAGGHQIVFINDPVAGTNYMLDQDDHTAHKMPAIHIEQDGDGVSVESHVMTIDVKGVSSEGVPPPPPPHVGDFSTIIINSESGAGAMAGKGTTESLGTQSFDGIQAEGTRTTSTIPAGKIGNDRPIQIISERWYSSDLHVVVMSKHSDPRMGENVYQLSNINRTEPAASLFEVPSDYTVKEDRDGMVHKVVKMRQSN